MAEFKDAIAYVTRTTSLEELGMVIRMAAERRRAIGKVNAAAFRRGDKVKFKNRDGIYVFGEFVRRLRKNVEVKAGYTTWRVSPQLIERAD